MIIDYDKYKRYRVDYVPVRHKRKDLMKTDVRISSTYRDKIDDIGQMDRTLKSYILSMQDYMELVQKAHSVNAHWSTKIEGNNLSLKEVEESSRRIMNSKVIIKAEDPGPGQEILNHLYSYFMPRTFELPWSMDTVQEVHRSLMTRTGEDCTPGKIRENGEEVHVTDQGGQELFIGCPSIHVEAEMEQLLDWIDSSPFDRIITAIVFFHEFESIHPFIEGNGRTGRSLFHILMQELRYRNINLCRLEDKLLGDSSVYYNLMRYTDKTGDYTPLIEFFIDCIHAAYSEAVKDYGEKDALKDLDENSRLLAVRSREHKGWFSIQDASRWISSLGEQSIRMKLNELVGIGILEKSGKTRSLVYRFNDPFRPIKKAMAEQEKIAKKDES